MKIYKFKAFISIPNGSPLTVYVEADNAISAKMILEAQYKGCSVTIVGKV